jgi:hypothetical protein
MTERTAVVTPTDVRYGFQGQEEDNELWSGAVSFKYRVEDARLGRFFSVDPLSYSYPWNSANCFSENRLLDGVELEGLEYKPTKDKEGNINGATYVGYEENGKPKEGSVAMVAWTVKEKVGDKQIESLVYTDCLDGYGTTSVRANGNGMIELPQDDPNAKNGTFSCGGEVIYKTYNRNDVDGIKDQWGKPNHIAHMINAVVEFNTSFDDVIEIGDMKSPSDGKVPVKSGKYHHGNNGAFDIRLLSSTSQRCVNINNSNFSIEKTQIFINCLGNHGFTKFRIGSSVASKFKGSGSIRMSSDESNVHDNHYHIDMN